MTIFMIIWERRALKFPLSFWKTDSDFYLPQKVGQKWSKNKLDSRKVCCSGIVAQVLFLCLNSTIVVVIYPKLLWEIFFDLMDNAVKYTPENGEIPVMVEKEEKRMVCRVSDTSLVFSESISLVCLSASTARTKAIRAPLAARGLNWLLSSMWHRLI